MKSIKVFISSLLCLAILFSITACKAKTVTSQTKDANAAVESTADTSASYSTTSGTTTTKAVTTTKKPAAKGQTPTMPVPKIQFNKPKTTTKKHTTTTTKKQAITTKSTTSNPKDTALEIIDKGFNNFINSKSGILNISYLSSLKSKYDNSSYSGKFTQTVGTYNGKDAFLVNQEVVENGGITKSDIFFDGNKYYSSESGSWKVDSSAEGNLSPVGTLYDLTGVYIDSTTVLNSTVSYSNNKYTIFLTLDADMAGADQISAVNDMGFENTTINFNHVSFVVDSNYNLVSISFDYILSSSYEGVSITETTSYIYGFSRINDNIIITPPSGWSPV